MLFFKIKSDQIIDNDPEPVISTGLGTVHRYRKADKPKVEAKKAEPEISPAIFEIGKAGLLTKSDPDSAETWDGLMPHFDK